jgi:sec-independent protein translocase protein TatB
MFDIGWGEFVVIGTVALVVIGPKELPGVLRTVGQTVAKIRRMAGEFQGQFREALREAELEETHKSLTSLNETASSFNPIQTIRDEIKSVVDKDSPASAPPPPEPKLDIPEPPPVPDLTPEQIRAAFDPQSSTAIEDFYVPSPETEAGPPVVEKPKRARTKKAADDEATVAAVDRAAEEPAPETKKRAPRKKAAKAAPAEGEGEEGGGA